MSEVDARLQQSKQLWRKMPYDQQITGGSIVLVVAVWFGAQVLFAGDDGYWTNLFTEGLSITLTVFILERFNAIRDEKRELRRIMREIKSLSVNGMNATDELREMGLLIGEQGMLRGIPLRFSNLENIDLSRANLTGTKLTFANLAGARFTQANLKGADLMNAKLQGANLWQAQLEGADLRSSNLSGAKMQYAQIIGGDLSRAELQGAELGPANLSGTFLLGANLEDVVWKSIDWQKNESFATLPDGTKWTEDTDMGRFTDENHPEYAETLTKIEIIRKEMGL